MASRSIRYEITSNVEGIFLDGHLALLARRKNKNHGSLGGTNTKMGSGPNVCYTYENRRDYSRQWRLPMQNGALRKVTELSSDVRHAMEGLIGRSLRDDEAIAINVYNPAPSGELRRQISRQLLERVDKTAAKASGISDDEIDAAIDEAADHVRHHPE